MRDNLADQRLGLRHVAVILAPATPSGIGQKASNKASTEDEIKNLDQEAATAYTKDGVAAVEKYEADDIISIDPMGYGYKQIARQAEL